MTLQFQITATPGTPAMIAKGMLGKAEVTVTINNEPVVILKNIMIRQGTQGPFVAYPSEKDQTGKTDPKTGKPVYYPIYKLWPVDKDKNQRLSNEILKKLGFEGNGPAPAPAVPASVKAGAKVMVPKAAPPPAVDTDALGGIQW